MNTIVKTFYLEKRTDATRGDYAIPGLIRQLLGRELPAVTFLCFPSSLLYEISDVANIVDKMFPKYNVAPAKIGK